MLLPARGAGIICQRYARPVALLDGMTDGGDARPLKRNPLWERACSRKQSVIQHPCRLTDRFREQARSHKGPNFQ
ncbi:hypothetical protein PSUM_02200 [Pseudomonas umsongensis]|uniref:Uncharacterized protein n=1 Tax=Pseudomonas umsongensis TaxID=198618 RepID=A0ABX4E0S2_9PSED|nr:hypothetical protein PSUM_02200 [Pseudomonas umsongensis]